MNRRMLTLALIIILLLLAHQLTSPSARSAPQDRKPCHRWPACNPRDVFLPLIMFP